MTGEDSPELPEDVQQRAERLTRRAREAVDRNEAAAYREERDDMLTEYGYTARVREDDRAVLVLYPSEWVEDGTVQQDRIEDIDRGIERPLEGPGEAEDWAAVDEHNRDVAEQVADEYGEVHGENALVLAEFCSNHYAKPIESMTREELQEFLTEYYPRNAWPSDEQRRVVEKSVRLAVETAGGSVTEQLR